MQNLPRRVRCAALLCGIAFLLSIPAEAQAIHVNRKLSAHPDTPVGSISVSATPSSVSFSLVTNGVASGSSAINITTTWTSTLCLFTCTVNLYAYFSSASAALSATTGGAIPSSAVLGEVPTGTPTTFTAFTQSNPLGGAGASLQLYSQSIVLYTGDSSRTDALSLEINLNGTPQQPAGTYSGTLYIQAQTL
jgi:hypothetical protein